jgi:hypothetical protein
MRFFSIKILILCILLPPLLYLLTVIVLEGRIQDKLARGIEEICTGDSRPLLDGSLRLRDAIRANVEAYVRSSAAVRYGISVRVQISSRGGKALYPSSFEDSGEFQSASNPLRVAQENFTLLNEGLVVQAEARLEHNRLLSNGILCVYLLVALCVLVWHYRSASRRINREETERRQEIERLQRLGAGNTDRLARLRQERENLLTEFNAIQALLEDERSRAGRNEDDMIREIENLEKKLAGNLELQKIQQQDIQVLKEALAGHEKDQRREDRARSKGEEVIRKRLATLYKNLLINDRAIQGLAALNEDLRLKAEEVIHHLNSAPDLVTIKRKVFGKKNRETVLEVVFAYKGRLYFRRGADRRVEVLAIGTKNTQERELDFLSGF